MGKNPASALRFFQREGCVPSSWSKLAAFVGVCLTGCVGPISGTQADAHQARDTSPTVEVATGVLSGQRTLHGAAFKGVPFAAPPVGDLRWRSPAPPQAWEGIRPAVEFGAPCAQAPLRGLTAISGISREDCLYLNVWTPAKGRTDKLPVMVWIHGGGFANGMGSSPTYDGDALSARGIIVVTLNYRLGVFGFLAHPDLSRETPAHASGNFGIEDQVAALKWVQANIAQFGGDPGNVTIFGQSAGGASVLDILTSPEATGLFRRAIIESGASQAGMMAMPVEEAEKQGRSFAGDLTISELRKLGTDAIIARATSKDRAGLRFAPVSDGRMVVANPDFAIAHPGGKPIELLIGSNSREGLFTPKAEEMPDLLERAFGPNVARAKAIYRYDEGVADPLLGTPAQQFSTDSTFRCGNVRVAKLATAAGMPTWQYQFEQFVPGREAQGAAHSFEVPYVFGNLSNVGFSAADYGPADRALAKLMGDYWTNFARTGDPNGPGLPRWPRYSVDGQAFLRLASSFEGGAELSSDLGRGICPLFIDPN